MSFSSAPTAAPKGYGDFFFLSALPVAVSVVSPVSPVAPVLASFKWSEFVLELILSVLAMLLPILSKEGFLDLAITTTTVTRHLRSGNYEVAIKLPGVTQELLDLLRLLSHVSHSFTQLLGTYLYARTRIFADDCRHSSLLAFLRDRPAVIPSIKLLSFEIDLTGKSAKYLTDLEALLTFLGAGPLDLDVLTLKILAEAQEKEDLEGFKGYFLCLFRLSRLNIEQLELDIEYELEDNDLKEFENDQAGWGVCLPQTAW